MYFERFYDDDLAQASYLVGCQKTGEAIVIDPARQVRPYLEAAEREGLTIVAATETHIHADYISGSRELSRRVGAKLYLSDEGDEDWKYRFAGPNDRSVKDGDEIVLGGVRLKVIHTPGHTPEHISFLLTDTAASLEPMGVFTGDFLFVGDVGRPDLLEKAAGFRDTMKKGAQVLYRSLQRFAELPDHLQIWPAHGAGSACGKALGAVPTSVLAYEKLANWAFACSSEEDFVEKILDGQPEPPYYFAEMKRLNKVGPLPLPEGLPEELSGQRLTELLESKELVVDLRGDDAFAAGHPRNALFLPKGRALATWAGWLLPYDRPHYLIVEGEREAARALDALRSIGLDATAGLYWADSLEKLGQPLVASRRIEASELERTEGEVLDVRGESEWKEGHLSQAKHLFVATLPARLDEVPKQPILYCGTGTRSLIGSSILQREGFDPVDVLGGYAALQKSESVTR